MGEKMRCSLVLSLLFLIACADREFREAEEMVRQQKFYNAIELYLSFVREHPGHRRAPEALLEVGNLQQLMLNEQDKAIKSYRKLVASYPVNSYTITAQQRIAEIQKNHFENFRQAIIEYENLIRADPDHIQAASFQFEIAQCYTLLHNYDQAAIEYKKLVEHYPKFERLDEVYFQMGNNDYIAGHYDEARKSYQMVSDRFPNSSFRVQAIFGIGSTYEEEDRFDEARKIYQSILKSHPTPRVLEIRLAKLAERQKKKGGIAPGAKLNIAPPRPKATPKPTATPTETPEEAEETPTDGG